MAAEKQVKTRVLSETSIDGKTYKPNQLVSFGATQARLLEREGKVDPSPGAVKYCESKGAQLIEHPSKGATEGGKGAAGTGGENPGGDNPGGDNPGAGDQ